MDDFKPTHRYIGRTEFINVALDLTGTREVQAISSWEYSKNTLVLECRTKYGQIFALSKDNLEKLEEKEMKFTNENIAKGGWIVGSFKHGVLSFAPNPVIHPTEAQAKAEALRLAQGLERKFVWLKIGGAVSCGEVVWED